MLIIRFKPKREASSGKTQGRPAGSESETNFPKRKKDFFLKKKATTYLYLWVYDTSKLKVVLHFLLNKKESEKEKGQQRLNDQINPLCFTVFPSTTTVSLAGLMFNAGDKTFFPFNVTTPFSIARSANLLEQRPCKNKINSESDDS